VLENMRYSYRHRWVSRNRRRPSGHGGPERGSATVREALAPDQKEKAVYELEARERLDWHYVPRERGGISLKELTPAQRHLATGLLGAVLSQRGMLQATTIMSLEAVLAELEQGRGPVRDAELYYVSVFGEPAEAGSWGWRFEGHHLSLNFLVVKGHLVAVTPSFWGANPAEVKSGPRQGLRTMAARTIWGAPCSFP
jgi:hypothetical protein